MTIKQLNKEKKRNARRNINIEIIELTKRLSHTKSIKWYVINKAKNWCHYVNIKYTMHWEFFEDFFRKSILKKWKIRQYALLQLYMSIITHD